MVEPISRRSKMSHDQLDELEDDKEEERFTKARRHDIELPEPADSATRLAEKLDSILKIGATSKRRYHTNKLLSNPSHSICDEPSIRARLKPRNLSEQELKERVAKKYSDSLVPELDPRRTSVRVAKILSASESLDMVKTQAKKQLMRQMELDSMAKNQLVHKVGIETFRFNDGYEMPLQNDGQTITKKSAVRNKNLVGNGKKNSVKFLDTELTKFYSMNDEWEDGDDFTDDESETSSIKDDQ